MEHYDDAAKYTNAGDGGKIDARSGSTINPLDPDPGAITLDDIAHGLSRVCRFAGQCRGFYSVARHSVLVSREVEARGAGTVAQRLALVHDAPEAYLSDVPGPAKAGLPDYKRAERGLMRAVETTLGVSPSGEDWAAVEAADEAACAFELGREFPHNHGRSGDELRTSRRPAADGGPDEDERLFLARAQETGLR